LVEAASVSTSHDLGKYALDLLKELDFEQSRPMLQRVIAKADTDVALKALGILQEHEWPERRSYLLSLLAHRSKQIRYAQVKWLMKESLLTGKEPIIEDIAPYLAHSTADARLTAIDALQSIGGEQAHAMLAARLDVEKSLKV